MRIILLSVFLSISLFSFAQNPSCSTADTTWKQDEYKGNNLVAGIRLDFGFSSLTDAPVTLEQNLIRSRAGNVLYFFHIPLYTRKFTLSPGLGVGIENYSFKYRNTVLDTYYGTLIVYRSMLPYEFKKSKLSLTYFDVPLELTFRSRAKDPRAFKLAIGGKIGVLIKSQTKIKYEYGDDTVIEKKAQDYNINRWRYGLTARIGYGLLSVYGYYALNKLFEQNKGPEVTPYNFGISLSLH